MDANGAVPLQPKAEQETKTNVVTLWKNKIVRSAAGAAALVAATFVAAAVVKQHTTDEQPVEENN